MCIVRAQKASRIPKSEGDTMAKSVKTAQLSLLLLVVIGAVAAAPASAASPEWWVEGSEIAKAETVAEAVTIKQAPTFKVGSVVTVTCSTVKVKHGIIRPGNSNNGTFVFESCSTVKSGTLRSPQFQLRTAGVPTRRNGRNTKTELPTGERQHAGRDSRKKQRRDVHGGEHVHHHGRSEKRDGVQLPGGGNRKNRTRAGVQRGNRQRNVRWLDSRRSSKATSS